MLKTSRPVASDRPVDLDVGDLQMVAEFEQQVVGVAVSASGRVFVSFPRNGIDTVKNSVEEVIENKAVAYPNEEINTLNTAAPSTHFLSAQSVYVDSSDTLWVLDVGNLGSGTPLHLRRGQTRGHRPADQRGQADHRVPGQSDHEGHIHQRRAL